MFFCWDPARWEAKWAGGRPGRVRRKWDGPAGHTCRSSGKQSGPGGRPGVSGLAARRPAWFALTFPQALCFRFPGANLGPGISGFEARRPGVSRRGLLPPPANPCGSVPGSKFFTQIPRLRTKSTLPVYRQGASLSSTVPPQVPVPRGTFN